MSASTEPDWRDAVNGLIAAVGIAREAYQTTRRRKSNLSNNDFERIRACELEIATYLGRARKFAAEGVMPADGDDPRRRLLLDLFRTHSLVWESNWLQYDGLPKVETGHGMGEAGAKVTLYVQRALAALAFNHPDFDFVEWDGRERFKEVTPLSIIERRQD